jgi:hypothetical protein
MKPVIDVLSAEYISQWNDMIQRATIDSEFREELIREPKKTLEEFGIFAGEGEVIIHEFNSQERHLFLPPLVEEVEGRNSIGQTMEFQAMNQMVPCSKEVPSDSIKGLVTVALLTEDSRVWYGKTTIEED